MSLSDDVIVKALEYLTDVPMDEIKEIEKALKSGENPITFKKKLAYEVVKQLNDENKAKEAEESFQSVVQEKQVPQDIQTITVSGGQPLSKIVIEKGLVETMSEWKRLVEQHGVSINETKIDSPFINTKDIPDGGILKIGKRNYVKIVKQ
jgi:tyrosyl-tRNA synthetase